MSLAYSGSICATGPEPRVARCHTSTKARKSATETTDARSVSEAVMCNAPKGEGRRAVLAGQARLPLARTIPGPTLAFRGPADVRPPCSCRPLDGETLDVFVGLCRIELLAHHLERLAGRRRRGEADLLHQPCRIGGEIDLLRDRLVVDVALDLSPALHLREKPDGERLPGEGVEVDAVRVAFHRTEAVGVGAGEDLLEHRDRLVEVVRRRDRLGDLFPVLLLGRKSGGV